LFRKKSHEEPQKSSEKKNKKSDLGTSKKGCLITFKQGREQEKDRGMHSRTEIGLGVQVGGGWKPGRAGKKENSTEREWFHEHTGKRVSNRMKYKS